MKYIPVELYQELENDGEEIDKMLNGYMSFLKKSKQGANEPGANYHAREESATYSADSFDGVEYADDNSL